MEHSYSKNRGLVVLSHAGIKLANIEIPQDEIGITQIHFRKLVADLATHMYRTLDVLWLSFAKI